MHIKKLVVLSSLACLSGCALAPGMQMAPPPAPAADTVDAITPRYIPISSKVIQELAMQKNWIYRIDAQDVLSIGVWNHPEFSISSAAFMSALKEEAGALNNMTQKPEAQMNGFVVAQDGSIFFPLIGKVQVAGKTVDEIRSSITKALRKYIHNPQVSVRVAVYRSKKVYVMGEVVKPGLQAITDTALSLADAINLADGLNPYTADPRHIFIIRGNPVAPDVYWLDAKSPTAMLLAQQFHLQPKDVVYVSAAEIARWNRGINQILPTVQTVWYTRSLTR